MARTLHPFTLYFIREDGEPGWKPGLISVDPGAVEKRIRHAHPLALERRVVAQGRSQVNYDGELPENKYDHLDFALDYGWWYDTTHHCWVAPEEAVTRPVEKPLPATMEITTEAPSYGWWEWLLTFRPLVSNDVVFWRYLFGGADEAGYGIEMSELYDPLPAIERFVIAVEANRDARVAINEEVRFTGILAWQEHSERLHVRIMSIGREEDVKYDFLIKREDFVKEIRFLLSFFNKVGGWTALE